MIIPTFNREPFLKRAINSVLNQTYKEFDLIIIDDGSTDSTAELIRPCNKRLKYIYQENKGPAGARNRGVKESKAEFICFLDSDDWWDKDKLAIQLKAMRENPEYLISHTQEIWYKNGQLLNQKPKHRKYSGFIFDKCLPICAVGMSTIMAKREIFDEVGFFNEGLPCCEDYDLWLKVSAKFPFLLVDKPLTLKDGGRADQVSTIHARGMDKFRIQGIKRLLGEGCLSREQRNLALQELEKKCRIYGQGCIKHGREEEGNKYLNLVGELNR